MVLCPTVRQIAKDTTLHDHSVLTSRFGIFRTCVKYAKHEMIHEDGVEADYSLDTGPAAKMALGISARFWFLSIRVVHVGFEPPRVLVFHAFCKCLDRRPTKGSQGLPSLPRSSLRQRHRLALGTLASDPLARPGQGGCSRKLIRRSGM